MDERTRRIGEAIAAWERGGEAALERACADSPDLATDIRGAAAAFELLRGAAGPNGGELAGALTTLSEGTVVGHFRIVSLLGQGGMGKVFRARDVELDREVALKVVELPFITPDEALTRIRREARLIAQVRHDNIVGVHEVGQTREGLPYFVMDLIEGTPLSRILAGLRDRKPADLEGADLFREAEVPVARRNDSYPVAVARLLLPIAEALEAAHAVGVVHRDVKPSNILVDRQGRPHLVDFGIAREAEAASLTATALATGTPPYMAPEQIAGGQGGIGLVTAATDVYALGVTLYQALTLHLPFEADSVAKTLWLILHAQPRPLRALNPGVSIDLETICLTALEKRPRDRYAGAGEFADDLRRFLEQRPISRRPLGRLGLLQRYVRNNPWPVTAVAASVLTLLLLTYGFIESSRAQRIETKKGEAYDFLTTVDGDFKKYIGVVAELNQLAPEMSELRDFNQALELKLAAWQAGDLLERSETALSEARSLMDAGRSADSACIESLYAQSLAAVNEWAVLQPNQNNAPLFQSAFDFRRDWLDRRLARGPDEDASADSARLALQGTPEGAEVHLLRYERQSVLVAGGEDRLVPVPVRRKAGARAEFEQAPSSVAPGSEVLVVEAVEPDSPAAASGLREGDFVLEVGGRRVDGGDVVLPVTEGTNVPPWSRLVRLGSQEVHEELDVEVAHLQSAADSVQPAECIDPSGAVQQASLRRTRAGFEPAPRSVREALEGPIPPGGLALLVASGSVARSVALQGGGRSGLRLTSTFSPVVADDSNRIGSLPLELGDVPAGSWLLVVRAPGFETLRLPVLSSPGQRAGFVVDLLPRGTAPAGFVAVPAGPFRAGAPPGLLKDEKKTTWPEAERWLDSFWISRTEVTAAQYEQFLRSDLTQATLRKGELDRTYSRVPRIPIIDLPARSTCRPLWEMRDGLYVASGDPERPIRGISCDDADAYCRWLTRTNGNGWFFRLPTEAEWEKAARGVDGRLCPWGDAREPRFSKCRGAHEHLLSASASESVLDLMFEPVSRPTRDESPYGVLDTAGNVLEWCLGTSHRDLPFRRPWRGGAAGSADAEDVVSAIRGDGYPERISGNDGFRVVAWRSGTH